VRSLIMALVLACCGGAVAGETPADIARARQHFEAGRALYNLGNYQDAIREFSAGYQLVPRPQFLLNLGQAYRRQGDLPHARDMFRKFLAAAPPNDPDRNQARVILDEIEDTMIEQQPLPSRPARPPLPERGLADPYANVPSSAPLNLTAPAPDMTPRRSFMSRHWWIIPVSIAAFVGLGVGVYYAVKPDDPVGCGQASLGCLAVSPR
jgi:tetratricopeptide (TPR) repeat protein